MTFPHHGDGRSGGSGSTSAAAGNGTLSPEDDTFEPLTPEQLAAEWEEERPPHAGPLANVAASVAVAAVGTAGLVLSLGMGLGTPEKPEAGMWPFIISLVLVVMSVALLAFGRKAKDAEAFSRSSWQVAGAFATLAGFVLALGRIGFEIPALLLTLVWLKFLGKETWRMSVLLSVVITAAFYLIFVVALRVPVPHLF